MKSNIEEKIKDLLKECTYTSENVVIKPNGFPLTIVDACWIGHKLFDLGYQEAIDKACKFILDRIDIERNIETNENGEPLADSYLSYAEERLKAAQEAVETFKKYMLESKTIKEE